MVEYIYIFICIYIYILLSYFISYDIHEHLSQPFGLMARHALYLRTPFNTNSVNYEHHRAACINALGVDALRKVFVSMFVKVFANMFADVFVKVLVATMYTCILFCLNV